MIIIITNRADSYLWRKSGLWRRLRMRLARDRQFSEQAKGFMALAFCIAAMWAVAEVWQR